MTFTSVFAPIEKSVDQDDGTVLVYGKATDGSLDCDQQRCDPGWLAEAMPAWYAGGRGGNVREQHDSKRAVGKAIDHEIADDGHYVTARIVDPVAVAKTRAGVFTGFSIGIRNPKIKYDKASDAAGGIIAGGEIVELSLCDRPANPACLISLVKSAKPGMSVAAGDFDSKRMLVRCEELVEKSADSAVEKATDVAHLDAPAPGQKCADCGEDGHLTCIEVAEVDTKKNLDYVEEATEAALNGDSGCGCCNECVCDNSADKAATAGENSEFDAEAAKALVAAVLAKADSGSMPPEYDEEQGDVQNAQQAISIISQLIVSEAQEMCDNPAEDCDIQILLSAVQALRCFICREQEQAMGSNDDTSLISLAAEAEAEKADSKEPYGDVTYADPGYQKDGVKRYPLDTKAHAKAAWGYINQEGDAAKYSPDQLKKVKARIVAACKKFGIDVDESKKAVNLEVSVSIDEEKLDEMVDKAIGERTAKVVESEAEAAEVDSEKATEPDTTKATTVEVETPDADALEKAITAALEKAFSAEALEKADNPFRKTFTAIVEASTKTIAETQEALGKRLVQVEQMAVPGGPVLRRTETERKEARKNDLMVEAAKYKALAQGSEDPDLRRGYAIKAAQIESQIKAL